MLGPNIEDHTVIHFFNVSATASEAVVVGSGDAVGSRSSGGARGIFSIFIVLDGSVGAVGHHLRVGRLIQIAIASGSDCVVG